MKDLACLGFNADFTLQTFCHTAAYPKPIDIQTQKELPDFFPTPAPIIEQMLELADIQAGCRVLEPSCGKGDILDAITSRHPDASLLGIEMNRTLADVLLAKGYDPIFGDFLQHHGTYDRVVMNPPFGRGQDISHVRHAYSLLAPGGRLVAIMSEGPFSRSDNAATEFRAWFDELGGESTELPDDAFRGH